MRNGVRAAGQAHLKIRSWLHSMNACRQSRLESCDLFSVFAGEQRVGVLYNFNHGGCVMNYQSGFRMETDNQLTPGFVCHALACQHYLRTRIE